MTAARRLIRNFVSFCVALVCLCTPAITAAQDQVLTVAIATSSVQNVKTFNQIQLDALPQTEVVTANDFVDGKRPFTGPLVRRFFENVTDAKTAVLTAVNEYSVEVPVSDFQQFNVILATRMSGELLSVRDKGPIWVIYPMSDHAELRRDNTYNSRLIWQLSRIEFR